VGYLYALLGALLFGANGSLTKLLIEAGLTGMQITQFRTLGTALIAALVLVVTDRRAFRLTRRQLGVMVLLGIVVAVLQSSYAVAIGLLPVGIALLLEYVAVLLVALVAFLVFRERVKPRLWVAIGLVLLGLVAVARPWEARLDPFGVVMALLAAVSLALYFLIGERQVARIPPLAVAFWTTLVAGLVWLPFSSWWELDAATFGAPVALGGQWGDVALPLALPLAVTVVVGSFLPFWLSFMALKHLTATAAGVVASSEVVFAFAVAWIWLGEALDAFGLVGAGIVLAGIVIAQTARATKTVVDAELVLPQEPARDVGGRP
jgi:drug/metabolite transporter (DMT)-like permease